MKPYELLGWIQQYEAEGDEGLKTQILKCMEALTDSEEMLPEEDAVAYFFGLEQTGDEKYKKAMDRIANSGDASLKLMPFMAAYETAYRKKEHYNLIAQAFTEKESLTPEDMAALINTVEQMSQEIYEYYRELKDLFCKKIKEFLPGMEDSSDRMILAYSVLKACNLRVLQPEKYRDYGIRAWSQAAKSGGEKNGVYTMVNAQYEILKKTGGLD
ncbi:MAG TPA: hypothetical protein H9740_11905 [Candidatus Hungatella pullicola]|nr:hypothetical protein [Candidatus Hungatella pullicola]